MPTLNSRNWGQNAWGTYMLWCYKRTHLARPHDHTFYELFWVESGQGYYWINGETETLKVGDLVLVRPEDSHSFAAVREGEFMEFINVGFIPRIWTDLQKRYFQNGTSYFGNREPRMRRYHLPSSQLSRLGAMSSGLRAGSRDRLTVEAFIMGLLSMLEEGKQPLKTPETPCWLSLAVEQIRLNPNFSGGPAAFARLAGRSPEHVARECRRWLGRKPNELVNEARMEHAARELKSDRKTILEIALECGIENLGHFYQLFKKWHGMSPASYRRKYGEAMRYATNA